MESNHNDFDVIWTRTGFNSFDVNIEFIKRKWNNTIVERFISSTELLIERIRINPFLYPKSTIYKKYHRAIIHKNVTIFYRIIDDRVYIILFWDNRQDPIFLKELLSKV